MQVDLYDLVKSPPKRMQSLILDHSPRTIALSPCGTVLAVAYDGGIEVSSLSPSALPTDRRAVKCDAVDALAFSFDGIQILGTTTYSSSPSTVILTAPYYDPVSHNPDETISGLWTTSILFPNTSRDCSHAVLLQESSHEEAYWTLTYDRSFEAFRAIRIDDLRNGTTYFAGPAPTSYSPNKLLPCTLPAATYHGEVFSAGFQGKEIWVYGVPEDLDALPNHSATCAEGSPNPMGRLSSGSALRPASRIQEASGARPPQWQALCDKLRHTFVAGAKVASLEGVNTVKWVGDFGGSSLQERLVVAAKGVSPHKSNAEDDDVDFVDGGRIVLLDFDYRLCNGTRGEVIIEVGTKEPEVLEEQRRDLDTEVAIVRRRTVAQRGGRQGGVSRAATTASTRPALPVVPSRPTENDDDDPLVPRRVGQLRPSSTSATDTSAGLSTPADGDRESISIEEQDALDAPYSHASPRSGTTLRRAATAVAMSRHLHTPAARNGRYEYRRADGRREHPHESDADNWVPPPPPYQKDDPQDLPAFLRNAVIDHQGNVVVRPTTSVPRQTSVTRHSTLQYTHPNHHHHYQQRHQRHQQHHHRRNSSNGLRPSSSLEIQTHATEETPRMMMRLEQPSDGGSPTSPTSRGVADDISRPVSSWTAGGMDANSLYDVSPPDSPTARSVSPLSPPSTIREARASSGGSNNVSPFTVVPSQRNFAPLSHFPQLQTPTSSPPRTGPSLPVPQLNITIPSPNLSSLMPSNNQNPGENQEPSMRLRHNSQTWPRDLNATISPSVAPSGFPHSAPPMGSDMVPNAVSPQPGQTGGLSSGGHGSPQRQFSATVADRVAIGSRSAVGGPSRHLWPGQPLPRERTYPEPDQPLIVSTPAGVHCAFDPPGCRAITSRAEMEIIAPIPRHPRPTPTALVRPSVERLGGIYSGEQQRHQQRHQQQHQQQAGGLLAPFGGSFLNTDPQQGGPCSTKQRQAALKRRKSRASRSAQKNVADAKKKGWIGGSRGRRRKVKNSDPVGSAAWTDVSRSTNDHCGEGREKKCVMM